MPEIARLNEDGVVVGVENVDEAGHKTDAIAKTVRLDDGHDVRRMLRGYRWDFNKSTFFPLSTEPLDVEEQDTPELTEGIIEAIEDIYSYLADLAEEVRDKSGKRLKKPRLSARTRRTVMKFRRLKPRKRQSSVDTATVSVDADCVIAVGE